MLPVRQMFRNFVRVCAALALLSASVAHAASYVYDANGRLRAVTSSTGAASQYIYDALGNLIKVQSVATGQLAIFAFTPNHGPIGSSVTITGQGFTSGTVIKFNGTAVVSVTSVTATQLVVVVPGGATSGTISATNGTTTVTSDDIFTISTDSGGLPPTIASFSPAIADDSGTASVAVSGSNFISAAGATTAGVGTPSSVVSPVTNSSLNFTVAALAKSGLVAVATPYGEAQSTQPLVVVPASIGAANVSSSVSLPVDGTAQPISISIGKYVAGTFQGSAGQWISLQASDLSVPQNVFLTISDPSGAVLVNESTGTFLANTSIHLPRLPQTGTYLVLFHAGAGQAVSLNVGLETDPLVSSTSVTVSVTKSGQNRRVVYAGLAGQQLALNFPPPAPNAPPFVSVTVKIADPAEGLDQGWGNYAYFVNVPEVANLQTVPRTGLYTATIVPASSATMTAQVALVANPTGSLVIDQAQALSQPTTALPNEFAYFTFNAIAGQNISVGIDALSTNPSGTGYFKVLSPTGVDLTQGPNYCYLPGCHYAMTNLVDSGTYLVTVIPTQAGLMSYNAWVSTDQIGTLTAGTGFPINLARHGQVARTTFTATAGQYNSIYVGSIVPSSEIMTVSVRDASNTTIPSGSFTTNNAKILNLPAWTQSGPYTVQVEADHADTATAQLMLRANPVNTLTVGGSAITQSTLNPPNGPGGDPDEYAYMIFSGQPGQTYHLSLSAISTTASSLSVDVFRVDNNVPVFSGGSCPTSGCNISIPLPGTGTPMSYRIAVHPNPNTPATMSYSAAITSP